jgi:hypothetical protein
MSDELSRSATRVTGFDDGELDFQLLRQLGVANYGGGTVGEGSLRPRRSAVEEPTAGLRSLLIWPSAVGRRRTPRP